MAKLKHRYDGITYEDVAKDVRVKYKDYFTVLHLYKLMHEWLVMEGWGPRRDTAWPEKLYLQRETQQSGREYWIWWRMEKKMNAMFHWHMDLDIHINLVKDTEVMHDGQKYKTQWGEPEIKIYAKLVYDPENKFSKHPLLKGFKDIYFKRIIKKEKEYYRKGLHREVNRFIDLLKHYFQFKTYLPEPEYVHFFPDAKLEEKQ